jgi:hypothetical protein
MVAPSVLKEGLEQANILHILLKTGPVLKPVKPPTKWFTVTHLLNGSQLLTGFASFF